MTSYTDWHPGQSIAQAAARYTDLVNSKRRPPTRPPRPDQQQVTAAERLECPASPATSGPLTHHRFGYRETHCAFCNEHYDWILAAPTERTSP